MLSCNNNLISPHLCKLTNIHILSLFVFTAQDAKNYINNKAREEQQQQQQQQSHLYNTQEIIDVSGPAITINSEGDVLTVADATLAQQGLPPQQYDAFLLFADEDIDFGTEILERMEDANFKVQKLNANMHKQTK